MLRSSLFVSLLLLLGATPTSGQPQSEPQPALHSGANALQIQTGNLFHRHAFRAVVVSMKHHRTSGSAIRGGLGLTWTHRRYGSSILSNGDHVVTETGTQIEGVLRADFQLLQYLTPHSRFKLFYGAGPTLGVAHGVGERYTRATQFEEDWTTWFGGGRLLLGAEWFATSDISILMEYGTDVLYRWTNLNSAPVWQEEEIKPGVSARGGAVLGMSVYY